MDISSNGPTILDENRSSNLLIQRRMITRDVPQTGIRGSNGSPALDDNRSSIVMNHRRINNRDVPQTGIRESTRPNNNREARQNETHNDTSTQLRVIESIVISDDESDDNDVQVCTLYIGNTLFASDIYKH